MDGTGARSHTETVILSAVEGSAFSALIAGSAVDADGLVNTARHAGFNTPPGN